MSCLWDFVAAEAQPFNGRLHGPLGSVELRALADASIFEDVQALRGRNVLLATHAQLPTALALVELDGVAGRMVLATPDLTAEQLAAVASTAEADTIITDAMSPLSVPSLQRFEVAAAPRPAPLRRSCGLHTQWILLTSGTTGQPKLVAHTLESLAGALLRPSQPAAPMVWSTFYDIRRYGGLAIYMRALLSGAAMVLSSAGESPHDFLTRAAGAGVTHISGTPSHWRRALMSGDAELIAPEYVRLSGEVADQTVLDNLRAAYPKARVAHAFASTEAGVAFDVNDGLAGFPIEFIEQPPSGVRLKVQDGTLWIRSGRVAERYLGPEAAVLAQDDGFVDTGDMVELTAGRYHFRGRKGGIINVGGLKVYPEEVESILNADARVRMSLVKARRNPITGSVIVAEVVLANGGAGDDTIKNDLIEACRHSLAAHKVPASLRFVTHLELSAAGKLVRPNA